MNKRLSSKDFLELGDALWRGDAKVKYQNPDAWIGHLIRWVPLSQTYTE